jgi:uncharacterized protein YlxW (UPF0749 family)
MNTIELNPALTETAKADLGAKNARRNWWVTLFILCGLLGAMLGLSVRTQTAKQQQDKLDRLQGNEFLVQANADLQRRVAQLQKDNEKLVATVPSDGPRLKMLSKDLGKAQFFAGLTDVKGPGVIVTLNDSKQPFPTGQLPPGMAPPNLVHDIDINQVVNELKAAKAEAISINDQRLVAISPVRCAGPTVYVNDTPQTPPYIIKAIGDPKNLVSALNLPGGIADQMRSIDKSMFKVEKSPKPLVIPAYSGALEPRYAVPANTTTAGSTDKKLGV